MPGQPETPALVSFYAPGVPAVAAKPISAQLLPNGTWEVQFCGQTVIARAATITLRADGKCDAKIKHPR